MIVDCHTHFLSDKRLMSEHVGIIESVDKCIVLGTPQAGVDNINDKVSKYVKSHKDNMAGFAFIDPIRETYSLKKLRSLIEQSALSGVVLYCAECGFHPAHSKAMHFYEAVEELRLPVFFHNGPVLKTDSYLEFAQPMLLDGVARQFRKLKIIIGDIGRPFTEQAFAMLAKHENVFADFTINPDNVWQTYNSVVMAYENKLFDKVLFGSGYPQAQPDRCIEVLLGFNKLLTGANLPMVPRAIISDFLERDTLTLLGIKQ